MAARAYIGGGDPVARWVGDMPLFCQGPHCEFEEKKLHLGPVALWGATGGYF